MSFKVTLSEDGTYVICKITGPLTAEIARESMIELDRMCRAHNIKRVLNDVREVSNVLNVTRNYEFAYKDMVELGIQRDVFGAILTAPEDSSHDFVETVARNAGYNVRVFRDENAAVNWLKSERVEK